jgi:hypothetical protein
MAAEKLAHHKIQVGIQDLLPAKLSLFAADKKHPSHSDGWFDTHSRIPHNKNHGMTDRYSPECDYD